MQREQHPRATECNGSATESNPHSATLTTVANRQQITANLVNSTLLERYIMQPTSNPGNISLGQFSRDYDINKGTVSRKAKALGISTSEGLTPQAVDELKEAFGLNDLPAKPVEVEVYNSTETALAPIEPLPTRYDLAQFGSVPQASSALTQVNQALSIVDSLKAQMSLNTEAAYQQLEQSQQAAQQLARAQQELLLEAQKYSIEMNILGRLSAANNAQINSTMEAIQQLGKPQNVQ